MTDRGKQPPDHESPRPVTLGRDTRLSVPLAATVVAVLAIMGASIEIYKAYAELKTLPLSVQAAVTALDRRVADIEARRGPSGWHIQDMRVWCNRFEAFNPGSKCPNPDDIKRLIGPRYE